MLLDVISVFGGAHLQLHRRRGLLHHHAADHLAGAVPEGAGKADRPVRLSDSGSFHAHTRPPAPAAPGPPLLQKGAAGPAGAGPAGGARAARLFPAGVKQGRRAGALRPFAVPVSRGPRRFPSPGSPVLACGYRGSCFCPFRRELGESSLFFYFSCKSTFFRLQ